MVINDARTDARTSGTKPKVLVVDDEQTLTDLVSAVLTYEGFDVITAGTGAEAVVKVRNERPDLILLDVQLPDVDGFDVQSRLNSERARVPIIFLTARHMPPDKIRGLTHGADDYVTKPFNVGELVARVRAVLRRSGLDDIRSAELRFADLTLDDDSREVRRGDRRIDLTPTEYNLLHYLMLNAKRVLTKAQILDHVWRYDFDGDTGVVETYVFYLRKKIDIDGPPLIHTVRGVGYTLRLPAD